MGAVNGEQIVIPLWIAVVAASSIIVSFLTALVWIYATFERREDADKKLNAAVSLFNDKYTVLKDDQEELERDVRELRQTISRIDSNVSFMRGHVEAVEKNRGD